ncbi:MAG: hypothetical protein GWN58_06480 [Anaerolineae bacterium]|nr:hypothetical protein [Anaerolineae bacterium]
MLAFLYGIFVLLHGLVHLWYVTLSQQWVEFQPEMGWTGESWLFSPLLGDGATRGLATVLYSLATLGFVAGGVGVLARQDWWRPVVIGSAAFSAVIIILFWDGGLPRIVEKGLLGFLINVALLVALLVFDWPSL